MIENPLAKRLLNGEFKEGETVVVDVGPEGLTFAHGEDSFIARDACRTCLSVNEFRRG